MEVSGSLYQRPATGQRTLDWSDGNGMALLSGGGLATASATPISLDLNNRLISSGSPSFKLSINSSSGLVTGSFLHPDTGKVDRIPLPSPLDVHYPIWGPDGSILLFGFLDEGTLWRFKLQGKTSN